MEIQDAKQARPHCELIAELLDSRQPKTEREHAAVREIERLRHDIEWHIKIAIAATSELATENERLRCNAMQWRKPGPVTAEHPLDCLIVIPALRQADGDWWIRGSEFLEGDAPIAWCADTSIARAALAEEET